MVDLASGARRGVVVCPGAQGAPAGMGFALLMGLPSGDAGGAERLPGPACTFCRIAGNDVEAHIVLEDELFVAFLDRRPLFPGHTLLIPRAHVPDLAALPAELAGPFLLNARRLALAMEDAFGAMGAFLGLNNKVSQSVPHLHLHVVPRRPKDGLRGFFWPRTKYEDESAARAAQDALRCALTRLEESGP